MPGWQPRHQPFRLAQRSEQGAPRSRGGRSDKPLGAVFQQREALHHEPPPAPLARAPVPRPPPVQPSPGWLPAARRGRGPPRPACSRSVCTSAAGCPGALPPAPSRGQPLRAPRLRSPVGFPRRLKLGSGNPGPPPPPRKKTPSPQKRRCRRAGFPVRSGTKIARFLRLS